MTRQLIAFACENGCVPAERAADCALMATELVTNALLHGRGDITLTVGCRDSGAVRIEVRDAGSSEWGGTLHPAHADSDRETGRGLRIVEALAEDWGVEAGGRRARGSRSAGRLTAERSAVHQRDRRAAQ
jgi:anti-sigma regulatory factor (Ser/Thr protein kinase)